MLAVGITLSGLHSLESGQMTISSDKAYPSA